MAYCASARLAPIDVPERSSCLARVNSCFSSHRDLYRQYIRMANFRLFSSDVLILILIYENSNSKATEEKQAGLIMRRRTLEERYQDNLRKQQKILEEFAAHEIEWADDLLCWYRLRKKEIPDDEYRACAYFINKEFQRKSGSLTLLYKMYLRCLSELPAVTKELAFDLLAYRFKMYAEVLEKGGFS